MSADARPGCPPVTVSLWCATCHAHVEHEGWVVPTDRKPIPVHVTPDVLAAHRATHVEVVA